MVLRFARTGRNQVAANYVLFQLLERVALAEDGRFVQHFGRLLERCCRHEAAGLQCRTGNTLQDLVRGGRDDVAYLDRFLVFAFEYRVLVTQFAHGDDHPGAHRRRLARIGHDDLVVQFVVDLHELPLVDDLLGQETGIARIVDLYLVHHLAHDHLEVLVVDLHTLHAVYLLYLVDDVLLDLSRALDGQNIARSDRSVRKRRTGTDIVVLLHEDLTRQRYEVTLHVAHFRGNDDFAVAPLDLSERNLTVDFRYDGGIRRVTGLEELGNTRQTAGDITGGLPRVTELFEARNPSNPAIVSEIDGEISFGKIKRGNREIVVTSKMGDVKRYLVPLSRQILVQENDYVRAGTPLSDGAITPGDILAIQGPTKVQEYIVNEVQEVYRMQGVKINDKHFEVIVRQMMNKVQIDDPGDTRFLPEQIVDKWEFMEVNDELYDKVVVTDPGESPTMRAGMIITVRKLRDENSVLKRKDQKPVEVRDVIPATSNQILQGITRAALQTSSFMSAASFQETTKVLNEAAILGKSDPLEKLKENVICGHLIPAGTGEPKYQSILVGSMDDYNSMVGTQSQE